MSFPQRTIGELLQDGVIVAIQDGNHGEKHPKASDYVEDDGVPFVMARDFPNGDLDLRNATLLDRQVAARLRIGFARPGDVLLTHKGTVGATGIVPDDYEYVMLTPQVTYYRVDPKRLLNTFLRAVFRSREFQVQLDSFSAQSTRPFVSISAQRALQVPLPSLSDQRRIAGILSAYDDLIDNCERRIRILDEMARSLYREWFVHFRYPGHEGVPMVESELGPVPQGWRVLPLMTSSDVNALSLKPKLAPSEIRYIDIASVSPGAIDRVTVSRFEDAPSRARRIVRDGDVLWSCVRPNRRSFALVSDPDSNTIASTGFAVLSARTIPFAYLYLATTTDEFVQYLEKRATGAAYPAVTAEVFESAPILHPPSGVLTRFGEITAPMLRAAAMLRRTAHQLRASREMLVPRLLAPTQPIDP